MRERLLATCMLAGMLSAPLSASAANEKLYIKVQSSKVRAQPSFLASAVSSVRYGDAVETVEKSGAWLKVKVAGGKTGYVHDSAVSDKKISLTGAGAGAGADQSEVVMAGKGFSSEVERKYAASNQELNFRGVDEVQRNTVSEGDLAKFIRDGRLQQRS